MPDFFTTLDLRGLSLSGFFVDTNTVVIVEFQALIVSMLKYLNLFLTSPVFTWYVISYHKGTMTHKKYLPMRKVLL